MRINMHSENDTPVLDVEGPISTHDMRVLRQSIEEWFDYADEIVVGMRNLSASEHALVRILAAARERAGGGRVRCRWYEPENLQRPPIVNETQAEFSYR
jgi:hypothetical protein